MGLIAKSPVVEHYKKMKMKNQLIILSIISTLIFSCKDIHEFNLNSLDNSSLITFESENLFPEGIAFYEKSNSFLLSSYSKGAIYSLNTKNELSILFQDENLISPAAIAINEKNNYLYIANGDAGVSIKSDETTTRKIAGVLIYDLMTKKRVEYVDFTNFSSEVKCYANGLTLDEKGNVYVTDSHRPIIYKIDGKTNESSIFLEDEKFGGEDWNLNGIAYHPNGYLIAIQMSKGVLFKIDLPTKQISEIQLDENIIGADGITIINNNQILITQAFEIKEEKMTSGALKLIETEDDWITGEMTDKNIEIALNPTNSVCVKNEIFALNSSIGAYLFAGKNQNNYSLVKIK